MGIRMYCWEGGINWRAIWMYALDSFRMDLTLTGPGISPWEVISTSIMRNLSDKLRHNIVMRKPKKLEATKMSNTNKMRVELLTVGETEDEKWVGHLKRRINLGTWSLRRLWDIHCQMGRNGSLTQKRYKTREKDLGLRLGEVNSPQKSRALTAVKAVGERFNEQGWFQSVCTI